MIPLNVSIALLFYNYSSVMQIVFFEVSKFIDKYFMVVNWDHVMHYIYVHGKILESACVI